MKRSFAAGLDGWFFHRNPALPSPPLCWWARTEEYIDRLGFARRHLIHKSRLGGFNFLANCVGTIANTTCNSACKPLATTYKEQPAGGRKSSRTSRLAQETHIYAHIKVYENMGGDATAIRSLSHASQLLLLLARSNPRMSSSPRGLARRWGSWRRYRTRWSPSF